MNLIVCENYEEVSQKAFEIMKEIVASKPNATLGLATGSSPIGLYKKMVEDHQKHNTSYEAITSFNLDEYVGLSKDHPESYYSFMYHNLFDHINIKEENIHLPQGNGELEQRCNEYEAEIAKYVVDIQLLGVGRNGHIGFNEPGTPFTQTTHIVTLDDKTIQDNARFFNNNVNEVPTQAITMGIATIMKAKKVLLIASGENKAEAIYNLVHGEIREECPVTVLQKHADVVVIVDKAAASNLK